MRSRSKRQLFVGLAGLVGGYVFLSLQLAWPVWTVWVLLVGVYGGYVGILFRDMKGWGWLLSPMVLLAAVMGSFLWLRLYMDAAWMNVVGSLGLAIGVYGLLLTLNIMHISTVRPLPLARTAASVLSLSVFLTSFVLYYVALYIMPSAGQWVGLVMLISWWLAWPVLWFGMKGREVWWRSLAWSGLVAVIMGQLAGGLAFWPRSFMVGVFLSGVLYVVLGMVHYQERRQIKVGVQRQYLLVFGVLLGGLYLVTRWYGG